MFDDEVKKRQTIVKVRDQTMSTQSDDSFSDHSHHSTAYSEDGYDVSNNHHKSEHINSNDLVATNAETKILNNVPHEIEHFIGEQHESIFGFVYDDITVDNMHPFIVLLRSEGIGKSVIASEICHELIEEKNHLFCNGILFLDTLQLHKQHKCQTFEECLIEAIYASGLDTEKYDDFFDMNSSNVCSKVHDVLHKSLIVIEDFDRFKDINDLSLKQCNEADG